MKHGKEAHIAAEEAAGIEADEPGGLAGVQGYGNVGGASALFQCAQADPETGEGGFLWRMNATEQIQEV